MKQNSNFWVLGELLSKSEQLDANADGLQKNHNFQEQTSR